MAASKTSEMKKARCPSDNNHAAMREANNVARDGKHEIVCRSRVPEFLSRRVTSPPLSAGQTPRCLTGISTLVCTPYVLILASRPGRLLHHALFHRQCLTKSAGLMIKTVGRGSSRLSSVLVARGCQERVFTKCARNRSENLPRPKRKHCRTSRSSSRQANSFSNKALIYYKLQAEDTKSSHSTG
jgi:hypothetical protein